MQRGKYAAKTLSKIEVKYIKRHVTLFISVCVTYLNTNNTIILLRQTVYFLNGDKGITTTFSVGNSTIVYQIYLKIYKMVYYSQFGLKNKILLKTT